MQNILSLLDELHLKDLQNERHPSYFDINEGYNMLILRLPICDTKLSFRSFGFIFTKSDTYYYNISEQKFEKFETKYKEAYLFINTHIDAFMKKFSTYQFQIQDMEELLYSDKDRKNFMSAWFSLKRDITRVDSVLEKAIEAMDDFMQYYEEKHNDTQFLVNNYTDLHEHLERSKHSCELQLSKLDYIYNFYNTRTNERMNRLIYILTIISVIFLPLNLLVGFFGINTSGLPFTEGESGTFSVMMTMLGIFVVSSLLLLVWRKKI